ncbi:hypothetical protein F4825DRAFT_457277 [Nemania diffusa]|nr:hypothetical protein F4825DRAFT_457277 [Nemania diffusa]
MENSEAQTSSLPQDVALPPSPPFSTMLPPTQMAKPHVLPDRYKNPQLVLPYEDLDNYAAGGFHPVNLGDTFQGDQYTIRHKLGYGGSSIAWLAYDKDTLHVNFYKKTSLQNTITQH